MKGSWKMWVKKKFILCFSSEEGKNECVKGTLVVMCEEMVFIEKNVCKQKNMKGNYV